MGLGIKDKYNLWKMKKYCRNEKIRMLYTMDLDNREIYIIDSMGIATQLEKKTDNYFEYNSGFYSYKLFKHSNHLEFIDDLLGQLDEKVANESKLEYDELLKTVIVEDIKIDTVKCDIELINGIDIVKDTPEAIEVFDKDGNVVKEEEKAYELLKNLYYGSIFYCFNVVGVETGNIYHREVSLVVNSILNFPFMLTEDHLKTIFKNYYKGIAVSLKDYVELERLFYDSMPNHSEKYAISCLECGQEFADAQGFYNHLYKTGHKDSVYYEFPFDEQLTNIMKKHDMHLTPEEVDELFAEKKSHFSEEVKEAFEEIETEIVED